MDDWLFLVLAELGQHTEVFQRACVSGDFLAGRDVFEQPAHDFPASGLGHRLGEPDIIGYGQRSNFFSNVLFQLCAILRWVRHL